MTALILIVWCICIAGGLLTITGPVSTLAGAVGWIALGACFTLSGNVWRERVQTRRAYRAILALARDGRCIRDDKDFICACPGEATCGACWANALGLDPDEWLEWCKVNTCTT